MRPSSKGGQLPEEGADLADADLRPVGTDIAFDKNAQPVGAENVIRKHSAGPSPDWGRATKLSMALTFVYLAFVRALQLVRLSRRDGGNWRSRS